MDLQRFFILALSVILIFTLTTIITRLFGLRTFAKMSSIDFASTIAIGSILASVILSKDQSIMEGALIIFLIVMFQATFAYFNRKSKRFRNLSTNVPKVLMWKGTILQDNLAKCNIGESELMAKLREANVHHLDEVQAVVLESTGDISVLHNEEDKTLQDIILKGTKREF